MKIIGTMRALDTQLGAVRVEDVYDTDIDDLWQACTQPDRLRRWIAEVSGDLRLALAELHLHGAGWQAHLEDLARSLDGEPSNWNERWSELTPVYQSMPLTS